VLEVLVLDDQHCLLEGAEVAAHHAHHNVQLTNATNVDEDLVCSSTSSSSGCYDGGGYNSRVWMQRGTGAAAQLCIWNPFTSVAATTATELTLPSCWVRCMSSRYEHQQVLQVLVPVSAHRRCWWGSGR
jgi:hypothetical protein